MVQCRLQSRESSLAGERSDDLDDQPFLNFYSLSFFFFSSFSSLLYFLHSSAGQIVTFAGAVGGALV